MAFGMHDAASEADTEVMGEINMTPLVDVMLVLLIIFIITVPVMQHSVNKQTMPSGLSNAPNAWWMRSRLKFQASPLSIWKSFGMDSVQVL